MKLHLITALSDGITLHRISYALNITSRNVQSHHRTCL